ncbi:MAG TPA: CBS domain-containing protein [Nevskiaceae bacterium]
MDGRLRGLITRRELDSADRPGSTRIGEMLSRKPVVAAEDNSLREAADLTVTQRARRLMVVRRDDPAHMVGLLSQSDIITARARRLHNMRDPNRKRHWAGCLAHWFHQQPEPTTPEREQQRCAGASDGISATHEAGRTARPAAPREPTAYSGIGFFLQTAHTRAGILGAGPAASAIVATAPDRAMDPAWRSPPGFHRKTARIGATDA